MTNDLLKQHTLNNNEMDIDMESFNLIKARLDSFKDYKKGWYDGEQGETFDSDQIDWLANTLTEHCNKDLLIPHLFPTAEGHIQAEWGLAPIEICLEINLQTKEGELNVMDMDVRGTERDKAIVLGLSHKQGWANVVTEVSKAKIYQAEQQKILAKKTMQACSVIHEAAHRHNRSARDIRKQYPHNEILDDTIDLGISPTLDYVASLEDTITKLTRENRSLTKRNFKLEIEHASLLLHVSELRQLHWFLIMGLIVFTLCGLMPLLFIEQSSTADFRHIYAVLLTVSAALAWIGVWAMRKRKRR